MVTQRPKKMLQPGARIRVLVVDDSVVVRNMVTHALKGDPAIEIVGTAANGAIGLAKIPQVNPDVITLDIEMPEMNGLDMLRKLRAEGHEQFVIMFSTLTEPGAVATLDALMLGANDYVAKPSNCGSVDKSIAALRNELLPKVKQFFGSGQTSPAMTVPVSKPTGTACLSAAHVCSREVVAIGVSTGGPNALSTIIPMFPSSFLYPILIVQHMPPIFTRLLAERLQTLTKLKVEEATQGCAVQPGKILIAPGGFHMTVRRTGTDTVVVLDQSTPRNSCRPSVDTLFESVNTVYGETAIAAILTGMGQDGLRGVQALKTSGAYVIAQDEASSVVWGMPGFVAKAGLADSVIPLEAIVPEVIKQLKSAVNISHARGIQ